MKLADLTNLCFKTKSFAPKLYCLLTNIKDRQQQKDTPLSMWGMTSL